MLLKMLQPIEVMYTMTTTRQLSHTCIAFIDVLPHTVVFCLVCESQLGFVVRERSSLCSKVPLGISKLLM